MDGSTLLLLYNSRPLLKKFAVYLVLFIVCILLVSSSSTEISPKSLLIKNLPKPENLSLMVGCCFGLLA